MAKKILFIVPRYGGWSSYCALLKVILSRRTDIDPTFVVYDNRELPLPLRIATSRIKIGDRYYFFLARALRGLYWGKQSQNHDKWKGKNYKAIFVAGQHIAFGIATQIPRDIPIYIALDATGRRPVREYGALVGQTKADRWEESVFKRASGLFPMSHWAAESLISDYGIPPSRIDIIPPSLLMPDLAAKPARQPGGPLNLGFIGNPFRDKGGDDLVAVHQHYFRDRVRLTLVSRAYRPRAGAVNIVHYPFVSHQHLFTELIPTWDMFCLPTHFDMSPWVGVEAHAWAVPAVTTRTGGVPEICIDGHTGFVVPPKDRAALAERLAQLIDNADLRQRMGTGARLHAETNLNAEINYNRLLDRVAGGSPVEAPGVSGDVSNFARVAQVTVVGRV